MELKRYLGSILGLAVGDALGAPVEFRSPGTFARVTEMMSGGSFGLDAGFWTDDTSLALCLAESLLEKGDLDLVDQLERYVRWYREGHLSSTGKCFDIGNTTRRAIHEFETSRSPYSGPTGPGTEGNGSIMRLSPVPLVYVRDFKEAVAKSGESSRTTHGAREAVDSCRFLGALIWGAISGVDRAVFLSSEYDAGSGYWLEDPLTGPVMDIARGSYKLKSPPEIKGSGYVIECLEAALWAFYNSDSFQEGCLLAVNLGDDADTTAAVYGQLAGAYYGVGGIPEEWVNTIHDRPLLESFAERLFTMAVSMSRDRQ